MAVQKRLKAEVLRTLRSGPTRPSVLVGKVVESTQTSKREVREALHVLVDRRQVALTWHGELEAGKGGRR